MTGSLTFVWRHSLDAIFSLIWWQFTSQLIGKDVWLEEEKNALILIKILLINFLTLSDAKILKESMTCSAVSVSVFSRVIKSRKASKCTNPVLLGSTTAKIRWKSNSPCLSFPIEYPIDTKHDLNSSGAKRPIRFLSK